MPSVTIEHEGYTVTGSADFYGPYAECDGAIIESIDPATDDPTVIAGAEAAVQEAAYEAHEAEYGEPMGDPNDDYDDDGYDQVGPDYWTDPESGEPRCG